MIAFQIIYLADLDLNTGVKAKVHDTNSGYSCWEKYSKAMPLHTL
jgi:hypothetical protein